MKRHVSRSVLRRLQDEPDAVAAHERSHAGSCAVCQQRSAALAANATSAAAALAVSGPPETDRRGAAVDALQMLRRLRAGELAMVPPKPGGMDRLRIRLELGRRRVFRAGAVSAVVLVSMGTLVATGAAGNLVEIFQPDSFVAVPINISTFTTVPDLTGYGTTQLVKEPSVTNTATLAQAATFTGLHLLTPGTLPSSVKGKASYLAMTQGAGSFTFNAATAAGTVNKLGKPLPPLPKGLDGSSLTLQGGPAVVEVVGPDSLRATLGHLGGGVSESESATGTVTKSSTPPSPLTPAAAADKAKGAGMLGSPGSLPSLVIVQMKAPVLYSDGPTVSQYENALLSMPGVPPAVADQIRSLGNLSSTLPVPIPSSLASSTADINGSPGLVIGDTTGIASAVLWQSHGLLYGVVGQLTDRQVVAIARSMH